jgi:hypothetical protein
LTVRSATVKALSEENLNNEHAENTPTQPIFTRETEFFRLEQWGTKAPQN